MQITSTQTQWSITGQAADLAAHAVLNPGSGPDGQDALKLTVALEGLLEASEETRWSVKPGRAYQLAAQTRSALERCHGQLYLVWLDADSRVIAEEGSAHTFAKHDYTPLLINHTAPVSASFARAVFRVLPDTWPDLRGVQGDIWLSAATLMPSIAVELKHNVPGALYDAGQAVQYTLELSAAPADLLAADLHYSLFDYEGKRLLENTQAIPLAQGKGLAVLELPPLDPGYYELRGSVSAQGLAEVPLVKSFGCLGALDFNPAQNSPIALDAGISQPFVHGLAHSGDAPDPARFAEQSAACYKLGLRTLRDRFSWQRVSPTPETLDWGQYRLAANAQHAAGLEVYQMLSGVPNWSLAEPAGRGERSNYPPADLRTVYTFCSRAAREMGHTIRFWEFWNEPDIFFYAGHPWDLAAMTKAGALGFKDIDPTIGVLGGSRCAHVDFWRKWLANGVGAYIDIFNQHSYGKPEDEFALIQQDRDLMADVGLQRPVWMTEMGKRSIPSPDGSYTLAERIQVVYLLRAFACGLAAGIDRFFYFYLQEFLEAGAAIWGIQRQDLSPKPAVLALGALIRQIGEAKVVGYLVDDESYCVVFERVAGEYTAMVWSTKNTLVVDGWGAPNPEAAPGQDWAAVDGAFDLPVSSGARVVDALGRTVNDCTGSLQHIKLSICPLFVRGIDPSRLTLTPPPPALHYAPSPRELSPERHIWLQAQARPNEPRLPQADAQKQKNALLVRTDGKEQVAFWVHNYGKERSRVTLVVDQPRDCTVKKVVVGAVQLESGSLRAALDIEAGQSAQVLVDYQLAESFGGECCLSAVLFLEGAPHDQAAVYITSNIVHDIRY
ncbi:MAG: hypothetical protein ACYC6L_11480 [Anaerolineae bacterium]